MFAYDNGDDKVCYPYPRLVLTIFIAQIHSSIISWIVGFLETAKICKSSGIQWPTETFRTARSIADSLAQIFRRLLDEWVKEIL